MGGCVAACWDSDRIRYDFASDGISKIRNSKFVFNNAIFRSIDIFECDNSGGLKFKSALGNFLLKLLTFALLAAYLFGFSSILCSLFNNVCAQSVMMLVTAIGTAIAFILASEFILSANKFLFIGMFCVFIGLVVALFLKTPISFIPEQMKEIALSDWTTIIPVIFTAFGMQGSIHSVTKFCQNDRIMIRNACAFGCIVTVAIYVV